MHYAYPDPLREGSGLCGAPPLGNGAQEGIPTKTLAGDPSDHYGGPGESLFASFPGLPLGPTLIASLSRGGGGEVVVVFSPPLTAVTVSSAACWGHLHATLLNGRGTVPGPRPDTDSHWLRDGGR
jgi:hypothetical protein